MLRTLMIVGVSSALLAGGSGAALAQSSDNTAIGVTGGAGAGAVAGAVAGGPIGAVIGGFAGAALGAAATVPEPVVAYTTSHPVEPVYVQSAIEVGAPVTADITVHEIPDNPDYGYFYANSRAYVVDLGTHNVVYSPGYVVPQQTVTYIESNPVTSYEWQQGPIQPGVQLPPDAELVAVPENSAYAYTYVNDRPVLVDNSTRTVVWVK